jgi:cyanate hydratase-like protein
MNRQSLADKITALKRTRQISWKRLAEEIGRSPGFAIAALLGQMPLSEDEAQTAGRLLGLNEGGRPAPADAVPRLAACGHSHRSINLSLLRDHTGFWHYAQSAYRRGVQ